MRWDNPRDVGTASASKPVSARSHHPWKGGNWDSSRNAAITISPRQAARPLRFLIRARPALGRSCMAFGCLRGMGHIDSVG